MLTNVLGKLVLHIVYCQNENEQFILQDGGGGHLRFMHEQDLKI